MLRNDNRNEQDADITRRVVYGVLSLALTSLATWLAGYLTNKLLGELEND